jgi:hypothetical protein
MQLAKPDFVHAAQIQTGDVLIHRNSTVQVLRNETPSGMRGCKLVCRDVNMPVGVRPYTFWVGPEKAIPRVMANTEIAARRARGLP